ncbi:MAG TPA: DinB family protein [Chitinophagaceae bacterium]
MPRPDLSRVPDFFHVYVNQVPENDLLTAIKNQTPSFISFLNELPVEKRDYRYAEDKWTVKELLQHIMDGERIFAYRALCFARKDTTPLPSFDENNYADNSKADKRNWDEMVAEFKLLRQSNELMFNSFDDEQLEATGIASGRPNYVLAMGFIMVGHINHHLRVMRERYL